MDISGVVKSLVGFVIFILIIAAAIFLSLYLPEYLWKANQRKIAEKKCKEYTKFACDHPLPSKSSGIALGETAPPGMYPHMALLEFQDAENLKNKRTCAGSLISEKFILSSAHCANDPRNGGGVAKLASAIRSTGETYKISKIYPNPSYTKDASKGDSDYIILELERNVEFTPYLRPICLNIDYLGKYDRIIATGWDGKSEAVKSADLVIDGAVEKSCSEKLQDLVTDFICAGYPNSSQSTNQGDFEGPLQIISDSKCNMYEQIGVNALIQNRASVANEASLSFYTKVANAVPWIASAVWPNESA